MNETDKSGTLFADEGSTVICGIDEAGRGPLAGPLVVVGLIMHSPVENLADSKSMSEKRREELYDKIVESSRFHIVLFDSQAIDREGLSACMRAALEEIKELMSAEDVTLLFDGNSRFGVHGISTMVKADTKIAEVSAASIVAKVTRDRLMKRYASDYPLYGFEKHKGYGTKAHMEAIDRYGYSPIHRRSFKRASKKRERGLF